MKHSGKFLKNWATWSKNEALSKNEVTQLRDEATLQKRSYLLKKWILEANFWETEPLSEEMLRSSKNWAIWSENKVPRQILKTLSFLTKKAGNWSKMEPPNQEMHATVRQISEKPSHLIMKWGTSTNFLVKKWGDQGADIALGTENIKLPVIQFWNVRIAHSCILANSFVCSYFHFVLSHWGKTSQLIGMYKYLTKARIQIMHLPVPP